MILNIRKLGKIFGTKTLFKDGDFTVHKGDKIALIGQNGTGKSTLIKCIVGEEEFDGIIEVDRNIKISIMRYNNEGIIAID